MERYSIYVMDLETFDVYGQPVYTDNLSDAKRIAVNMAKNIKFDHDYDFIDNAFIVSIDDNTLQMTDKWQIFSYGVLPYTDIKMIAGQDFNGYTQIGINNYSDNLCQQICESVMAGINNALNEARSTRIHMDNQKEAGPDQSIKNLFNDDTQFLSIYDKKEILKRVKFELWSARNDKFTGLDNIQAINYVKDIDIIFMAFREGAKSYCDARKISYGPILYYLLLLDSLYDEFKKDFDKSYDYLLTTDLWNEFGLSMFIYKFTDVQKLIKKNEKKKYRNAKRKKRILEIQAEREIREEDMRLIDMNKKSRKTNNGNSNNKSFKVDPTISLNYCEPCLLQEFNYEELEYNSLCTIEDDGYMYKVCRPCVPLKSISDIERNKDTMCAQAMVFKISEKVANAYQPLELSASMRKAYYDYCVNEDPSVTENCDIRYFYVSDISLFTYLNLYIKNERALTDPGQKHYIWNPYTNTYIKGYLDYLKENNENNENE